MAGSKDKQAELTRGFLAHEDELQTIWAAGSCALGSSPGLASSPSSRTGTPFRLHLFCCGGCPLPLPPELKTPWRDNESPMGRLHGSYPCAHVQRGPSCRLRSRDSAVLGTRHGKEGCSPPRIAPEAPYSTLLPHMLTYARLIEDYEGELLGKRPQGSLARKARGVPTNTE